MGVVETEPIRGDKGAGLFDMVTQNLLQGSLEQMGRRVIPLGTDPGLRVDVQPEQVPHTKRAGLYDSVMSDYVG